MTVLFIEALKSTKIRDESLQFLLCFQYFKLSHHYMCWQARIRLQVSIITHCHLTRERVDAIVTPHPPPPPLKNVSTRSVYTDKYGKSIYSYFQPGLSASSVYPACMFFTSAKEVMFSPGFVYEFVCEQDNSKTY